MPLRVSVIAWPSSARASWVVCVPTCSLGIRAWPSSSSTYAPSAQKSRARWASSFALPEHAQRERDLVVHASGSEAGLCTSLQLAGTDATVLELSWFGDVAVSLPLGAAFHARRLRLRSSQVGTVSPRARARFDHRTRLALALELCKDPLLDCLIDAESRFENLPESMPMLTLPGSGIALSSPTLRALKEPSCTAFVSVVT